MKTRAPVIEEIKSQGTSRHTPGPYTFTGPYLTKPHVGDLSILAPEKQDGWCTVLASVTGRNYPSEDEAIATARLFACAADMFDILKRLMTGEDTAEERALLDAERLIEKVEQSDR